MTQIVEFTKHSDKFLIHHFDFQCNDIAHIGKFTGNGSLNKFMSLHDWHQIYCNLNEPVKKFLKNPNAAGASSKRQVADTNFELSIAWIEMDVEFYRRLLPTIDFNSVFSYVMKVNVSLCSNIDKFGVLMPIETAVQRRTTAGAAFAIAATSTSTSTSTAISKTIVRKKTQTSIFNESIAVTVNAHPTDAFKLKECSVRLPKLQFDENGQVIENGEVRNKRKHSSIANIKIHNPVKFTPNRNSTPIVRNIRALKQIENDVRCSTGKLSKRLTTPRTSYEHKTGSQFQPRIRLLNMPNRGTKSTVKKTKSHQQQQKSIILNGKSSKKMNGKAKSESKKKLKPKMRALTNETELFQTPTQISKVKKTPTKTDRPHIIPLPIMYETVKLEEVDLKLLTKEEIIQSYDEHSSFLANLFENYISETDATIHKATDYNNHFDIIQTLLTTDQFSIMLDILYAKIGLNYDTLFLELLIPEWALAIFMQRNSFDRETAIDRIMSQKSEYYRNDDTYMTIMTSKIDDSINMLT